MFDGVINVYKEKGYTSHDVVAKMRGILKQKKIGHTGTLDPDAQGVLPVCLGKATKLCDMLTDQTKTYQAVMLLGKETDTQDTSGKTLKEYEVSVTKEKIHEVISGFLGSYWQTPPMYSARKVNGKKLYELAREGKEIEREAVEIEIVELVIDKIELPRVTMTVTCSKGTYIRTLCYDIGRTLGCGGCMEQLQRSRVGRFELKDSLTLSQIEGLRDEGTLYSVILPVDEMFASYKKLSMLEMFDSRVHNGNQFYESQVDSEALTEELVKENPVRVYDSKGMFIGIYVFDEERQWFKPRKIFLGGQ